jgi:type IV secretory pathway VirB10-like protein
MRSHTTHARERSLRRLSRINRWLLAGSVTLTGVLTEVTAHAFPGKSKPRSKANTAKAHTHHVNPSGSSKSSKSIRPPAQAPQAAPEPETERTPEAPSESHSAPESPPAEESAAATEAPPEPEVAPAHEAAPERAPEAEAPVVSGGS